jgi:hypothetical protein
MLPDPQGCSKLFGEIGRCGEGQLVLEARRWPGVRKLLPEWEVCVRGAQALLLVSTRHAGERRAHAMHVGAGCARSAI